MRWNEMVNYLFIFAYFYIQISSYFNLKQHREKRKKKLKVKIIPMAVSVWTKPCSLVIPIEVLLGQEHTVLYFTKPSTEPESDQNHKARHMFEKIKSNQSFENNTKVTKPSVFYIGHMYKCRQKQTPGGSPAYSIKHGEA